MNTEKVKSGDILPLFLGADDSQSPVVQDGLEKVCVFPFTSSHHVLFEYLCRMIVIVVELLRLECTVRAVR